MHGWRASTARTIRAACSGSTCSPRKKHPMPATPWAPASSSPGRGRPPQARERGCPARRSLRCAGRPARASRGVSGSIGREHRCQCRGRVRRRRPRGSDPCRGGWWTPGRGRPAGVDPHRGDASATASSPSSTGRTSTWSPAAWACRSTRGISSGASRRRIITASTPAMRRDGNWSTQSPVRAGVMARMRGVSGRLGLMVGRWIGILGRFADHLISEGGRPWSKSLPLLERLALPADRPAVGRCCLAASPSRPARRSSRSVSGRHGRDGASGSIDGAIWVEVRRMYATRLHRRSRFMVHRGQVVLTHGGASQRPGRSRRGADPDSLFNLFSASKIVTATLVQALVDDGVLDLHARVTRWIRPWPAERLGCDSALLDHLASRMPRGSISTALRPGGRRSRRSATSVPLPTAAQLQPLRRGSSQEIVERATGRALQGGGVATSTPMRYAVTGPPAGGDGPVFDRSIGLPFVELTNDPRFLTGANPPMSSGHRGTQSFPPDAAQRGTLDDRRVLSDAAVARTKSIQTPQRRTREGCAKGLGCDGRTAFSLSASTPGRVRTPGPLDGRRPRRPGPDQVVFLNTESRWRTWAGRYWSCSASCDLPAPIGRATVPRRARPGPVMGGPGRETNSLNATSRGAGADGAGGARRRSRRRHRSSRKGPLRVPRPRGRTPR